MIEILAETRLDKFQSVDFLLLVLVGLALAVLVVRRSVDADVEWVRIYGIDAEGVVL